MTSSISSYTSVFVSQLTFHDVSFNLSLLLNAVTKPDHIGLNDWIILLITNCREEHSELSAPVSSGEICVCD
jgi:hypothetical protein